MKMVPIQILLGSGEHARVVNIEISAASFRRIQAQAKAAGVSTHDLMKSRVLESIDLLPEQRNAMEDRQSAPFADPGPPERPPRS